MPKRLTIFNITNEPEHFHICINGYQLYKILDYDKDITILNDKTLFNFSIDEIANLLSKNQLNLFLKKNRQTFLIRDLPKNVAISTKTT